MQHFSENYWKKRLAKTVFLGEKGKWPENGRNGEKGKRNRMPGKGKRQSSRSEIGAQEAAKPATQRAGWGLLFSKRNRGRTRTLLFVDQVQSSPPQKVIAGGP